MALWNDILGCHYNYIATDESLEKLQERENLEGEKKSKPIRRNISLRIFQIYSSTEGIFVYCSARPEVLSARNETCLEAIRRAYGRLFSV